MGAPFNANYLDENAIYDILVDDCGDTTRALELMGPVHDALRPLKEEVGAWHEWLLHSPECHHVIPKRKRRWLRNACGMDFQVEGARRAAAFILQGREAAYIHHLTLLSHAYGFTPISNQHDGLVTAGEVPRAAQFLARERSGFRYADLVEKPFV